MDEEFVKLLHQMADGCLSEDEIDSSISITHSMPVYLPEQIINRTKQADVQVKSPKQKKLELFFYSCKVSVAVAASVALMMVGTFYPDLSLRNRDKKEGVAIHKQINQKLMEGNQTITDWLQSYNQWNK